MVASKLDACCCYSMELAKETLPQIDRSKFRDDIADAKKSIEKTWFEKLKSRNNLFLRYYHN